MGKMSDRGFVSGFIGVGIHMTIQHILQDIHIANCCKKELADLKELVMGIELTIMHIQQNRMSFKSGKDKDTASAVNDWLGKLDSLLLDASKMVQRCSIPKSRLYFSGRPSKKEIWSSIKAIREHLELSPLLVRIPEEQVGIPEDQAVGDTQKVLEGLGKTQDSLESLASSATTSQAASRISERDLTALPETGVAEEADSWQLFKQYAFPYNEDNLPPSDIVKEKAKLVCDHIVKEKAKLVCDQCEGISLAIKVVGRAMARSTHPQQWDWALHRLQNANNLDDYLRFSFDALGNDDVNMQLCFQHVAAAFPQDEIIEAQEVIPLWMGEGLLARKKVEHVPRHVLADHCLIEPMIRNTEGRPVCLRLQDPFEIGTLYLDLLAERCLIEPTARDAEGRVLCFRMLNVVRDCAIPVAQDEESFYCCVGNGLEHLQKDVLSEIKRISLSGNDLRSLEKFSSSSKMCSLLISQKTGLTKIPKKVIGSMQGLKVLDLSGTSARSLPENVGRLKDLRCLKLSGTQIKRLPKSLRDLGHLEILDVSFTDIKELPSEIHMLRSLRYLGLRGCEHLQNLPNSISGLLSLQYLYMDGCCMWRKRSTNKCKNAMDGCRKGASLQSLGDLIQLKQLALQNDYEAISEGTLKGMTEMDTLLLVLAEMVSLPLHISDMSKLRRLSLKCSKLSEMNPFVCFNLTETQVKMKNDVTHLKNLSYLKFYECSELKNFQHLHKLPNLIQLEIILCPKVENFPPEFGRIEAFPLLKTFSLVGLHNLQGLPEREEGAMPSLEIFSMIDCPNLTMPQSYLNLGSRIRIRLHACPNVNVKEEHKHMVQRVPLPNPTETKKIIENYLETHRKKENGKTEKWLYGEFWCNELCNELFQDSEDTRTSS